MVVMAKPIKETPVLTGKDALRFEMAANNVIPAPPEEREKARDAFDLFCKIADFPV